MKMKKTKRVIGLLLAVLLLASLILSATVTVSAENAAVNNVKKSILQVRMFYVKDNEKYPIMSGTSFLINEDTILTCSHVVNVDDTLADILDAVEGGSYKTGSIGYEVVISKDVTIRANLKNQSVEDDFAILTLSEPIGGKEIVKIADSDEVRSTDQVFALGFPGTIATTQSTNTYTASDVTVTEGIVQKVGEVNGTDFIISAADLSEGVSGGPLVDSDGNVVAINQSYLVRWDRTALNDVTASKTGNYYSVAMHQVTDVLDALNIKWTPAGTTVDETEVSSDEPEETEAPEETLAPITATEPVKGGGDGPNWILIAIIALVVILIAVVVVVIIVMSKKKGNGPKGGSGGPSGPGGAYPNPPVPRPAPQPPVAPSNFNNPPFRGPATAPSEEGAGETSVLNDGAGETTVLGGGNQATGFTLIRKSSNQRIPINKPEFIIGKERRRVDYCIENNNSISRTHARIRVRGGQCFIADLGSTNATFVNGSKLTPNQEVAIKKGDKIKISDEEFELM